MKNLFFFQLNKNSAPTKIPYGFIYQLTTPETIKNMYINGVGGQIEKQNKYQTDYHHHHHQDDYHQQLSHLNDPNYASSTSSFVSSSSCGGGSSSLSDDACTSVMTILTPVSSSSSSCSVFVNHHINYTHAAAAADSLDDGFDVAASLLQPAEEFDNFCHPTNQHAEFAYLE